MSRSTKLMLLLASLVLLLLHASADTNTNTNAIANVFHLRSSHQVEPEAELRTSIQQQQQQQQVKESCASKCSTRTSGKLRCNLICNCRRKCIKRHKRGNKRYRRKRIICRSRCPKRADARIERRRQKREEKKRAKLKAKEEAEAAAADEETRIDLVNAQGLSAGAPMYRSVITDPVQFALPIFDPTQSVPTYGQCKDLERDIMAAVAYEVNRIINQCNDEEPVFVLMDREEDVAVAQPAADTKSKEEVTEDSFETNTQEELVDEYDVVKSDGLLVHIAYGHEIVTTNSTTGQVYARTSVKPQTNNTKMYGTRGQVQGLLLHECVLASIVSGYTYRHLYCPAGEAEVWEPPILSDVGSTTLNLYDVCNVPTDGNSSLTLLASHDLRGRFVDSRAINGTMHVVTQANIDTWHHLKQHLQRWSSNYRDMNCSEYSQAAQNDSIAYIRSFGQRLVQEIAAVAGNNCTNVARIVAFADGVDSNETNAAGNTPNLFGDEALIGSLLSVTTLKLSDPAVVAGTATPSTSSAFFRGYSNIVYSSKDTLVVASNSWRFLGGRSGEQSTYLMTWHLSSDGGPAVGGGTGIVPGYTKDSYSMSERDDHLRIATTSSQRWECVEDESKNYTMYDWCRWWCCGDWQLVANSTSQVMILSLPGESNGTMDIVSMAGGLGETEVIKSVRFYETFCALVTFRETDPLYTISLANNTAEVIGELKIDGYSSYMQQYPTDDGTLIILALGQNADPKTGRDLGLQLTLFNVTDMINPSPIIRYNIEENQTEQWSYSEAQFEPKALRLLPESKLLLLPASVRGEPSFDGFLVIKVTPELIEKRYSISMVESDDLQRRYWSCAYVQSRSIVIAGDATFFKGHTMKNIDLTTGNELWTSSLDRPIVSKEDSCGYWWVYREPALCPKVVDDGTVSVALEPGN